jgi:hypothetical protein
MIEYRIRIGGMQREFTLVGIMQDDVNGGVGRQCVEVENRVHRGIVIDNCYGPIRSARVHAKGATRAR